MLADVDRIMACLKDFMHGLLFRLHPFARFGTISNLKLALLVEYWNIA